MRAPPDVAQCPKGYAWVIECHATQGCASELPSAAREFCAEKGVAPAEEYVGV
jgi:hypothetical protein